jgi:inosose dehydratase
MAIKIGCFALINPFSTLDKQLDQIRDWGFRYADLTDNTDGACLGNEYGFTAVASLDANAFDLKRMFADRGLTMTSVCAHANLLDPTAPWRYGTHQIIKAVRIAGALGVKHVITSEGDPKTEFGHRLSDDQAVFTIAEKLHEPLRLAADYGVKILLEPHGRITDSVTLMQRVFEACASPALGLNLDTGNLWLGGGDPVEMIGKMGHYIEHVHWKDLPAEFESKRGTMYGCGMGLVALGKGVIGIEAIYRRLVQAGFDGHSTLEVAGEAAVLESRAFLQSLGAE